MGGGYFPEEVINDIRGAANIAEVISDYVALRSVGRGRLVGLCPFHAESKPSFSVNEDRQIFHCFGCGQGGNIFTFLMKHNQMSFPEAVREMARRYGVRLPELKAAPGEQLQRERLIRANELACAWFRRQLGSSAGQRARDYLAGRGLTGETLEAFRLGYAPPGWEGLKNHLVREGVPQELAEKAGLLSRKEGGGTYDRFRDRIIFPIVDVGGGVAAFGGRVLDDASPKYLNSPESPVYSKSRLLYGLNLSRGEVRKGRLALIVEGYLDLISLWQAGVRNVVATLGTALTHQHLRLLRAQGSEQRVVIVFDSDEAGQSAAARSLGLFLQEGVKARLLLLPQGDDPDTYVRRSGPELFLEAGEISVPLLDFYMERVVAAQGPSPEGRLAAARELAPVLANIGSAVERAYYVKRLSERLGLDEAAIAREAASQAPGEGFGLAEAASRARVRPSLERTVVKLALASPEAAARFAEARAWEQFEDAALARLAEEVCLRPGPVSELIDRLEPEQAALVSELALADEFDAAALVQAVDDCLGRLTARQIQRQDEEMREQYVAAQKAGDAVKAEALRIAMRDAHMRRARMKGWNA